MSSNIEIMIYLERVVERIGDYSYDPTAPYAQVQFYAFISNLNDDIPCEIEVRLGSWYNDEKSLYEDSLTITPRSLNEQGEIGIPLSALTTAIDQIRTRTQESKRAVEQRVNQKADSEDIEARS